MRSVKVHNAPVSMAHGFIVFPMVGFECSRSQSRQECVDRVLQVKQQVSSCLAGNLSGRLRLTVPRCISRSLPRPNDERQQPCRTMELWSLRFYPCSRLPDVDEFNRPLELLEIVGVFCSPPTAGHVLATASSEFVCNTLLRILNASGFERVWFVEGGLVGWPFELIE